MNHYLAAAIRGANTPVTITLVNYADGNPVADDVKFLGQNYTHSTANLFRLLSILSKPRNQFDYEYKGEIDGLHQFAVDHKNAYSVIDQFVIADVIFHVKKVTAGTIHAVKCNDGNIPQSGKIQSTTLPIKHLEMAGNAIVFEFHGLWFRIENNGFVRLYKTEFQCRTQPEIFNWQSSNNCVASRTNMFAILFGENDFGIVGNNYYTNNILNFFYVRTNNDKTVILTSDKACIIRNGVAETYSITVLSQYLGNTLTTATTFDQFLKVPILFRGSQNTTVQTSVVWGIQNTGINDIVLSKNHDAVCVPYGNSYPFLAFAIGENR